MPPVKTLVYKCAERQQKKGCVLRLGWRSADKPDRAFPARRHGKLPMRSFSLTACTSVRAFLRRDAIVSRCARGQLNDPEAGERTKEGWITMIGTDLDAFVTVRLEEPAEGKPTSLLAPHADLAKIDKGCSPNEIVGVEQKRRNAVTVESPVGARFGDSPHFLRSPTLPAPAPESARLEAPLSWRADGEGLSPAVQALARRFGYA